MDTKTLLPNLQLASYAIGIMAALLAGLRYLWRKRLESIESLRKDLIHAWTSVGAIDDPETRVVHLEIDSHEGDLIGFITGPFWEERYGLSRYGVNVDVGWGYAVIHLSSVYGRCLDRHGKIVVRMKGNRNRLQCWAIGSDNSHLFPKRMLLWRTYRYISE